MEDKKSLFIPINSKEGRNFAVLSVPPDLIDANEMKPDFHGASDGMQPKVKGTYGTYSDPDISSPFQKFLTILKA